MTTVVLRPDDTGVAPFSVTGAGSAHAATNDDSDASYITVKSATKAVFPVGTFALPAGTLTKHVRARARARDNATVAQDVLFVEVIEYEGGAVFTHPAWPVLSTGPLTTSFADYAGGAGPATLAQVNIDRLGLRVYDTTEGGIYNGARAAELYLDVVYATQPVVSAVAPAGTVTDTTQPIGVWNYTPGSDGEAQSRSEVKVYTAAQYGASGFNADTSTPEFTTGQVVGDANWARLGPLTNSTTYRMYVRAAQTINGQAHWSNWAFVGFNINVATSDVATVVAVPNDTTAAITVTATRSGGSHAWDTIELQRSIDSGATWEYVRGGRYVDATANASTFAVVDYEVGNTVPVIYRARASYVEPGGSTITGAWTQSTSVQWTSTRTWLKDPNNPTVNITVRFTAAPDLEYARPQGVFDVLGRDVPVVVSDILTRPRGSLGFTTLTTAERTAMLAIVANAILLLQTPPAHLFGSRYVAVTGISEVRPTRPIGSTTRIWAMGFWEVNAPSDPNAGTPA